MDHPDEANLRDVLLKTDLSRSTLIKYIKDLNNLAKETNFELAIHLEDDLLSLSIGNNVKKEDLIQLLLPFSVKTNILNYLYSHEEFTVQKLSQELFISEATLHRHLTSLNTLLKEFGITIKNGRLRGDEHQIRYFYYQFYWLTIPKNEMAETFELSQFKSMIEAIKQVWANDLTTTNEFKLALWFSITKKRIPLKSKKFKTLNSLMKIYQEHRFYQQLRQQILHYLSRYALEIEEEEVMCQFIFVTTMSILSPHVMERKLGYGGPISEATTRGLRIIRLIVPSEENLNEQGLYTLNQVLGQMYFFKGALIDRAYRLDEDLAVISTGMALEHADLAEEIMREVAEEVYNDNLTIYGDLIVKIRWRLVEVLSFVIYQSPKKVRVGVALAGSETKRLPVLTVLRQYLEVNRLVTLEPYHSERKFDFIISNVYDQVYEQPTYYLKGAPNLFDIRQLEAQMNDYIGTKTN